MLYRVNETVCKCSGTVPGGWSKAWQGMIGSYWNVRLIIATVLQLFLHWRYMHFRSKFTSWTVHWIPVWNQFLPLHPWVCARSSCIRNYLRNTGSNMNMHLDLWTFCAQKRPRSFCTVTRPKRNWWKTCRTQTLKSASMMVRAFCGVYTHSDCQNTTVAAKVLLWMNYYVYCTLPYQIVFYVTLSYRVLPYLLLFYLTLSYLLLREICDKW